MQGTILTNALRFVSAGCDAHEHVHHADSVTKPLGPLKTFERPYRMRRHLNINSDGANHVGMSQKLVRLILK